MVNSNTKSTAADTDIINIIIGYEEHLINEKKEQQSKRTLQARRAIERHKEERELGLSLSDHWFDDEP